MLYQSIMIDILNCVSRLETELAYLRKLISSMDRVHRCRNKIMPIHTVSTGQYLLKLQEYQTKIKLHADIKYE